MDALLCLLVKICVVKFCYLILHEDSIMAGSDERNWRPHSKKQTWAELVVM